MPGQGEPGYLAERSGVCPVSGCAAAADEGVEKGEAGMNGGAEMDVREKLPQPPKGE